MWSFNDEGGELENLGQTVVIIGRNNSGKSNIRRAIQWIGKQGSWLQNGGQPTALDEKERHDYGDSGKQGHPSIKLSIELSKDELDATSKRLQPQHLEAPQRKALEMAVGRGLIAESCEAWSSEEVEQLRIRFVDAPDPPPAQGGKQVFDMSASWIQILRNYVAQLLSNQILLLSGWRKMDDSTSHGSSYVKQLAAWRGAVTKATSERQKFNNVQDMFRSLTGLREAELEVTTHNDILNVNWRNRILPMSSFGDGIQHLLMLSLEFTLRDGWVFLVEEPETHLHPELQRGLVKMMKDNPQNQYIITTHSPVLLDSGAAESVYRVEYDGDRSTVKKCKTTEDLYRTLDQLDARASDVLQANCVIWVEGPTDRMFIRKCLEMRKCQFQEGGHYQIACYGGNLRAHVTFDEESADRFVNLMRLSRHVVMICDSDKASDEDEINDTKKRLQKEIEEASGFYWPTDGREIENYLPDAVLTAAYAKLLGDESVKIELGKHEKLAHKLKSQFPDPKQGDAKWVAYERHKVMIMPEILEAMSKEHLDRYDLHERLDDLIGHISEANSPMGTPAVSDG